jgi:hypothetical protein
MRLQTRCIAAALAVAALPAAPTSAQTITGAQFVNGLTLPGDAPDLSTGSAFDRRLGYFSDLYFDPTRHEWWALSDRGPGGGTLPYETRVQRFSLTVNPLTGQVSDFQVLQTVKFSAGGAPMNGIAPSPTDVLGNAFDPEGIVVDPNTGHLLVSDEYGPSLIEFDRGGHLVRRFATPANLIPRNAGTGTPNFASDAGNDAGKRTNRGFEGLAISPDGKFAYAVLQSAMLDEGGGSGVYSRIVKFDMATGQAVAQYAYRLETASQGRGVSALVALGGERFLVLERNNRGLGVGADASPPDKAVYEIDLAGASDVSGVTLPASGALPGGRTAVTKVAKVLDLDVDRLAAIGNKVPEKWEGLAIGPHLVGGGYMILAGTDNDYSVTQNAGGTQFDVWYRFTDVDPYASSIQCPVGLVTGCVFTTGGAAATLTAEYGLLPGVLHAYSADIAGYVAPLVTPEPPTLSLAALGAGLAALSVARRRRTTND